MSREVIAREVDEAIVSNFRGQLDGALDKARSELAINANRTLEAMDNVERMRKKLNLVITGLEEVGCTGEVGVRRLFAEKFSLAEEIKSVGSTEKPDRAVVKVECWDTKVQILKSKGKILGKSKVYIESDLTVREQRNAAKLRGVAKAKREGGCKARAINQRLQVDNQWFMWNECIDGIVRCDPPVRKKGNIPQANVRSTLPTPLHGNLDQQPAQVNAGPSSMT